MTEDGTSTLLGGVDELLGGAEELPTFAPVLDPTVRTGVEAMVTAAGARPA